MEVGDALVVAREWVDTLQTRFLVSLLRSRLKAVATTTCGVEVLRGSLFNQCFPAVLLW